MKTCSCMFMNSMMDNIAPTFTTLQPLYTLHVCALFHLSVAIFRPTLH